MTTNSLPGLHSPQANDPHSYLEHDRWTRQHVEDSQARALQACRSITIQGLVRKEEKNKKGNSEHAIVLDCSLEGYPDGH